MQNIIITLEGTGDSLFAHTMTDEEMNVMFYSKNISFDAFQDKLINIINYENVRITVKTTRGNEIFTLWNSSTGMLFNHIENNSRLNRFINSFSN